MDNVLLRLAIGVIFTLLICMLLIYINVYKRKIDNKESGKIDYGQIYIRNSFCTFAAMLILCDNIYEFLLFQACLLLGSIVIAKYVNYNKAINS